MGKRIICGCVVLGIVACLIGCQKSDNYELMKESKQQVLPIYEKKDAEVQGEKCALETLQDVYKSDYILEEWKIEKDWEADWDLSCFQQDVRSVVEMCGNFRGCVDRMAAAALC